MLCSLARHNELEDFGLWYGLNGGYHPANERLLSEWGFEQLVKLEMNRRQAPLIDLLVRAVANEADEHDYILLLQHDWECARTIPVDAIRQVMSSRAVETVRLYGAYKECRDGVPGYPVNNVHAGVPNRPEVEWTPITVQGEEMELGSIHWAHPPAVTKLAFAQAVTHDAKTERTSRKRSGFRDFLTARFKENVFWHIGYRDDDPGRAA